MVRFFGSLVVHAVVGALLFAVAHEASPTHPAREVSIEVLPAPVPDPTAIDVPVDRGGGSPSGSSGGSRSAPGSMAPPRQEVSAAANATLAKATPRNGAATSVARPNTPTPSVKRNPSAPAGAERVEAEPEDVSLDDLRSNVRYDEPRDVATTGRCGSGRDESGPVGSDDAREPARSDDAGGRRTEGADDAGGRHLERAEACGAERIGAIGSDGAGTGDGSGRGGTGGGRGRGIGFGDGGGVEAPVVIAPPPAPRVSKARPARLVYPTRELEVEEAQLYVMRVTVDSDGYVAGASLVRGFGGRSDEVASAQIWRFRYDPARDDDGRPVRSVLDQRFLVR